MSSSQRRYEITTATGHRYWEISRTGRRVKVAYGRVGEEPREHRWVHANEDEAASAMERRARDKLKAGFSLVASDEKDWAEPAAPLVNPVLEAEIANDLDAVEPFLVYGDWLVDHGEARGELIALQCNLEGEADTKRFLELQNRVRAILREHPSVLGPLSDHQAGLSITWRRGYIDRLIVRRRADTVLCAEAVPYSAAATFLRSLTFEEVDEPTARVLARVTLPHLVALDIRWAFGEDGAEETRMTVVERILAAELAPNLSRLRMHIVGDPDAFVERIAASRLAQQIRKIEVPYLPTEAANRLRSVGRDSGGHAV